jgi:hypothetical protein
LLVDGNPIEKVNLIASPDQNLRIGRTTRNY